MLDPFCGSGGTALAALMEGRRAVAIDRSPAATFVTKNTCLPISPTEAERAFETIEQTVGDELDWLYETRCDRCGGRATTGFTVYSQVYPCGRCARAVPIFDGIRAEQRSQQGRARPVIACPYCLKEGYVEAVDTRGPQLGAVPVMVSYLCHRGCSPVRGERRHHDPDATKRRFFEEYDLAKIEEIASLPIPHAYPLHKMMNVEDDAKPWGAEWRRGRNFRTVAGLFTTRNLWALAALREAALGLKDADLIDLGMFALTGAMFHLSRMSHHKAGGGGIMVGTYYLPQVCKERNAFVNFSAKCREILNAARMLASFDLPECCISTQSACELSAISSSSIDYIFTDPPYADTVQYGELNFVWEAWLGLDTHWHGEEIVVNAVRGISPADWAARMGRAMSECYRVLKPGRWLTLCYHDASRGTWSLLQDIMTNVGFEADQNGVPLFIDTRQKSFNQVRADKATKRDLVVNFRKPRAHESAVVRTFDARSFEELGSEMIREYLTFHPGATKDRIYDTLVSRMVRVGRMEAHDFDALLRSVADESRETVREDVRNGGQVGLAGRSAVGRWFLKGGTHRA